MDRGHDSKGGAETPLTREVHFSFAVIKRSIEEANDQYLVQFDEEAGRYQLIGGKVEAYDDTSKDAAIREACEELDLPGTTQMVLEPLVIGAEFEDVSPTTGDYTHYTMDAFFVESMSAAFPTNVPNTKWATLDQVLSPTLARVFRFEGLPARLAKFPGTQFTEA